MQDNFFECLERTGKTIQTLRIYKDTGDGTKIQINLSDGTTFTCSLTIRPNVEASLYEGGVGTPKVLQKYEV